MSHSAILEAPIEDIWNVLDDFKNIYRWHFMIESLHLLSNENGGIGALRRVKMYHIKSWIGLL